MNNSLIDLQIIFIFYIGQLGKSSQKVSVFFHYDRVLSSTFDCNQGCSRLFEKWGAHLYWALFPGENWGAQSTFYLNTAKKLGGPGPPRPVRRLQPCVTKSFDTIHFWMRGQARGGVSGTSVYYI